MFNFRRLLYVNRTIIGVILAIVFIGLITLFSAANGNINPWVTKQFLRFILGVMIFGVIVASDLRWWIQNAYLIYLIILIMLILVEFLGFVGMGAQRWLDFYFFNLQPSELMRVALILCLARHFSLLEVDEVRHLKNLIFPLLLIFIPVLLAMRQPDLGTAILLLSSGLSIFFVSGVPWWFFATGFCAVVCAIPVLWNFLYDYQKKRILIFLNPESDPAHAGYHISQSKIALGSGGFFGKGWLKGTQSHLNFLPEKQTDFIFTMFAEEFGLFGCIIVIVLFSILLLWGFTVADHARHKFSKLVAIGITTTLFLYVFINISMVMGLLPVVGVPLPFMSYGGTAMITLMLSMGVLANISIPGTKKYIEK
ncbi:MAG: rod shape-determining protein RodA [Pseudomonadota bacterium]|jgi:rod shape determining protein RodA|nr:rod shape-determining protein RodA [Alphaproteobacteria bacterium]